MEQQFVKLTNKLYKLMEFFPEGDPLKNRAKDRALVIMENLKVISQNDGWTSFHNEKVKTHVLEDIDTLLGYLWIAKSQNWLNSVNYIVVANEYKKICKELKPLHIELAKSIPDFTNQDAIIKNHIPIDIVLDKKEVKEDLTSTSFDSKKSINESGLPERQIKIMQYLAEHNKAQVMDLQSILQNVTKRTIRRDLDELLSKGKIERLGEFNEVFYKLK